MPPSGGTRFFNASGSCLPGFLLGLTPVSLESSLMTFERESCDWGDVFGRNQFVVRCGRVRLTRYDVVVQDSVGRA